MREWGGFITTRARDCPHTIPHNTHHGATLGGRVISVTSQCLGVVRINRGITRWVRLWHVVGVEWQPVCTDCCVRSDTEDQTSVLKRGCCCIHHSTMRVGTIATVLLLSASVTASLQATGGQLQVQENVTLLFPTPTTTSISPLATASRTSHLAAWTAVPISLSVGLIMPNPGTDIYTSKWKQHLVSDTRSQLHPGLCRHWNSPSSCGRWLVEVHGTDNHLPRLLCSCADGRRISRPQRPQSVRRAKRPTLWVRSV